MGDKVLRQGFARWLLCLLSSNCRTAVFSWRWEISGSGVVQDRWRHRGWNEGARETLLPFCTAIIQTVFNGTWL